jgi:hypothetical protein
LKSGPARQINPGLELGRIDEKIKKFKAQCNKKSPARRSG